MSFGPLPFFDLIALGWAFGIVAIYEIISSRPSVYKRSIAAYVQAHREAWMMRMSARDNRIVDGQLLGWLVNANAFFASTSVIAIGGLAALLGYADEARSILEAFPYAVPVSEELWELKVLLLITIMVYAFFKFAWAFRLSHYTVIMMGATPEPDYPDTEARLDHARRTARLLGLVGEHSNLGLRSFYYTMAGLMWFFHPAALMAAATWIVLILLRRDFLSHSRLILRGESACPPAAHPYLQL